MPFLLFLGDFEKTLQISVGKTTALLLHSLSFEESDDVWYIQPAQTTW